MLSFPSFGGHLTLSHTRSFLACLTLLVQHTGYCMTDAACMNIVTLLVHGSSGLCLLTKAMYLQLLVVSCQHVISISGQHKSW